MNQYSQNLSGTNGLIPQSRSKLDGTNNLSWYISKVSYFVAFSNTSLFGADNNNDILGALNPSASHPWAQNKFKHTGIINQQTTVINPVNKIFEGFLDSDNYREDYRDDKFRLHFSGDKEVNNENSLLKPAIQWFNKLYEKYNEAQGVSPTKLVKVISVIKNSPSSITLTVDSQNNTEYYFARNENGIYKGNKSTASNTPFENTNSLSNSTFTFNNVLETDILYCYVKDNNGRFHISQPIHSLPIAQFYVTDPVVEFNSSGGTKYNNVFLGGKSWYIDQSPNFITSINFETGDINSFKIITPQNSSNNSRSGNVIIKNSTDHSILAVFTVFQSGSSSTSTPLTSLNPSNPSSEWQGYGTTRFNGTSIDGNTINIGGTNYTQGIGTHASSRIVYNIGGQGYQTLVGKFGIDMEANCGDGAVFSIKADGATIYGPITKTHGQAATVFSVSVDNKSTIELIATAGANPYCDHTDWADLFLQSVACSTPPSAPTNVTASPSTISSGSSSLSAACSIGSPVWSTGQTGSPVSVSPTVTSNYTVYCQSNGCPNSSSVGVTVTVTGSNPCNTISNNLTMGTWTVTGHPLVARFFHNQYWLTQRIGTNPEKFLVRGSNMLTRGDVNLANSSFSGLTNCFAWQNSNFGGLAVPNTTQFPTPAGFTLAYEPDGTPFYTASSGCTAPTPSNVVASPANITSGQSATLSASCPAGTTYLWNTNATTASISVAPTATTTYNVKCKQAGCSDSPAVSVTVTVGPCNDMTHNLVLGTWNVTGHQLVVKVYNNKKWLVQRIATNPEKFLVRGSEMLTRGDVTLNNATYSTKVDPGNGGVWFPTPNGWQLAYEPDGTPFYTSTGGGRLGVSDITSINEPQAPFIYVYPNPAHDMINLKINLQDAEEIKIDLMSSSGQIYRSQKINGEAGQNSIPFNLEGIQRGHYLIRVMSSNRTEALPLVLE